MSTYLVTGTSPLVVDGREHQPGDTFTATLPPALEAAWLRGRHIAPHKPRKTKEK